MSVSIPKSRILEGRPSPRGAAWTGLGVNFSIFSENAEGVELRGAWGDAWVNDDAFANWQKAKGAWARDAALRLAHALAASDPMRPVLLGLRRSRTSRRSSVAT